jgi:hypothetical protein
MESIYLLQSNLHTLIYEKNTHNHQNNWAQIQNLQIANEIYKYYIVLFYDILRFLRTIFNVDLNIYFINI